MNVAASETQPPPTAQAALRDIARVVSAAPDSQRLNALRDGAVRLREFVSSGDISGVDAVDRIFEVAERHKLEPIEDVNAIGQGVLVPIGEYAEAFDDQWTGPNHFNGFDVPHEDREETTVQSVPVHKLQEWDAGEFTGLPPPREWLLGNQFCRRFLSGVYAPGATGKTALRTLQYLSLATGRALTGQHVFKRSRVLLLSLEDDDTELQRRIMAARLQHDISAADLQGWLFCATPKGIKLAEHNKDGARVAGPLERMLRDVIKERQIDLIGLDPFVKLHSMEENDNGAMDFVSNLLVKIAIDCNIAVDAPHHTKKGQLLAGDADAGRGASSARDAGRLMYTLTRMTDAEGETFGIPAAERRSYVRLDSSKVNIAAPSSDATWFKIVGVNLGNGTADYPNGDEVQTVIPWHPPKTWDGVTDIQVNAALDDIEAGMPNGQRFSDAPKAGSRAAWSVVSRHCPDRTEPQCREIIRTWVRSGLLLNEDYDDPIDRKPRKGLRVVNGKRPS